MRNEKAAPGRAALSEETATKTLFDLHSTGTTDETAGEQLRRRRQASLRCEPLGDGRRDTLAKRRRSVGKHLVAEVGKRTVWLRDGDRGDRVFALLDAVQLEARQWDSTRRCWMVSVARADDVLAFAEYSERWTVTVQAVQR